MTDVLTKEQRSYNMKRIRSSGTKPEIILKKLLMENGIKNCKYQPDMKYKPDFLLQRYKTVIFVDGCFWHKCPKCFIEPKTKKNFWITKINNNVKRDRKVNKELRKEGWNVIRIREHHIRKNPSYVILRISKFIGQS